MGSFIFMIVIFAFFTFIVWFFGKKRKVWQNLLYIFIFGLLLIGVFSLTFSAKATYAMDHWFDKETPTYLLSADVSDNVTVVVGETEGALVPYAYAHVLGCYLNAGYNFSYAYFNASDDTTLAAFSVVVDDTHILLFIEPNPLVVYGDLTLNGVDYAPWDDQNFYLFLVTEAIGPDTVFTFNGLEYTYPSTDS